MKKFIPKKPEMGETRTIKKFAWFPKIIGKYKIWLEYYTEHQEFKHGRTSNFSDNYGDYWHPVDREFINNKDVTNE